MRLCLFFFLSLILLTFTAQASGLAKVVLLKGKLKATVQGQLKVLRTVDETLEVAAGDVIQTGFNTRAKLIFEETGDTIELYSLTLMTVRDPAVSKQNVVFPIGKARFKVRPFKRKRPFFLKTANAVIGVKGTDFVVETDTHLTNLATISGLVAMASLEKPLEAMEVMKNFVSQVVGKGVPLAPIQLSEAEIQSILTKDTKAEWKVPGFQKATSKVKASDKQQASRALEAMLEQGEMSELYEDAINRLQQLLGREFEIIELSVDVQ